MVTKFTAEYTKLDGSRNVQTFETEERRERAFDKVKAEYPNHSFGLVFGTVEVEVEVHELLTGPRLTRRQIHLEKCQEAYESRVRGYGRY